MTDERTALQALVEVGSEAVHEPCRECENSGAKGERCPKPEEYSCVVHDHEAALTEARRVLEMPEGKDRQAWMAKWCTIRSWNVGNSCTKLDPRATETKTFPECPPEGRPDCPALKEMPEGDDMLNRTWNDGSNWSRKQAEMPEGEPPRDPILYPDGPVTPPTFTGELPR